MLLKFLLALALASSGVTAASAADLRIPLSKSRPPVKVECTNRCAPAAPAQRIGTTPIGKGALQ